MFTFPTPTNNLLTVENAIKESKSKAKRENDDKMVFRSSPKLHPPTSNSYSHQSEFTLNAIDKMLETEKNNNKTGSWNKLDKTVKTQKLHTFAEKYGKEHGIPIKDVKALKLFFLECLEKNKLSKTKDLVYDKETNEITGIPSLIYQASSHHFTLKNIDPKRVSTLKALNPKALTRIKESRITDDLLKMHEAQDTQTDVDKIELGNDIK